MGTDFDNRLGGAMGLHWSTVNRESAFAPDPNTRDEQDKNTDDEAPETPLDEPRPPRVQDPPPEPDPKGPYVVRMNVSKLTEGRAVTTSERKERRGFASMSAEKQREIASKGGRAAHEKGTAHEWTADEARNAGRKGGQVSRGGRGRLIVPSDAAPAPPSVDDGAAANRAE
jgi:general stress protein YciG